MTLWDTFIAEDALLVEVNPLAKVASGNDHRAGRQGLARRERRLPPARATRRSRTRPQPTRSRLPPRPRTSTTSSSTARSASSATVRVWSCRTLDVVAYAGENHGGVKPANFLDIGGGASAEVMANGLEIILGDPDVKSVFVNVFGGITACDEVANGIVQALAAARSRRAKRSPSRWSCASTATTRSWVARSSPTPTTRSCSAWTPWTARPTRPPSSPRLRSKGRGTHNTMAIFLTKDSKVIVQGMTGATGMKHTKLMLADGTNIVGGVNPRKAGTTVDFDGTEVPVFGSVAEAIEKTGAERVRPLRAAGLRQGRRRRGDRRRDPPRRRHHRGHRRPRLRRLLGVRRRRRATRPGSSARTAPV